jgi:hypothetical protein
LGFAGKGLPIFYAMTAYWRRIADFQCLPIFDFRIGDGTCATWRGADFKPVEMAQRTLSVGFDMPASGEHSKPSPLLLGRGYVADSVEVDYDKKMHRRPQAIDGQELKF